MSLWDKAWPGPSIRLGLANGAAPLGGDGKLPREFLPSDDLGPPWEVKTADFEALFGRRYKVDTTAGPVTATIAASVSTALIMFMDTASTWALNSLTLNGAGRFFDPTEDEDDQLVCDIPGASISVSLRNGALDVQ